MDKVNLFPLIPLAFGGRPHDTVIEVPHLPISWPSFFTMISMYTVVENPGAVKVAE